jgi:hypothetical protein
MKEARAAPEVNPTITTMRMTKPFRGRNFLFPARALEFFLGVADETARVAFPPVSGADLGAQGDGAAESG